MRLSRRKVIQALGAAGAGAAAADAAAVWTPISRNNQANTSTWQPATVDTGNANTWRKVGPQQVANCVGYLPAGYCAGNVKYIPPDGNWSGWGLGFTANNDYGYTGTLTNCSTVSVSPVYDTNGDWNYCNCGSNCTFYYTNCNCNCASNCNCSGFCCFPRGTKVRLADGSLVSIEAVPAGEELAAALGVSVVEDHIICTVVPGDFVYSVNDAIECTQEQLFFSVSGEWLAVDIEGYHLYRAMQQQQNPDFGLPDGRFRQMRVGDQIHTVQGLVTVSSLTRRCVTDEERLYSFVLNNTRTFFANDYLVESRVSPHCFNLSDL